MKRRKIWLLLLLFFVLFFYLTYVLLLNFGVFNRWIKSGVENFISKSFNGKCEISNLKGNLNRFQFKNLTFENEKVKLSIKKINISLSLSSFLFKRLMVNKFFVEGVMAEIKEGQQNYKSENKELNLKDFKFNFLLPHFENNLKIDLNNVEVSNVKIVYKGNIFTNSKFLSSINIKKDLIFAYYKFLDLTVDTFKVKEIEGEISYFLMDSIILNNSIISDNINSEFSLILKDTFLFVKNFETKISNGKFEFERKKFNIDGKISASCLFSPSLENADFSFDIKRIGYNSFSFKDLKGEIFFRFDTLNFKKIECNDKNLCLSAKGFIDFDKGLNGEFLLKFDSLSLESFISNVDLKKNRFYGNVNFKTDFLTYITVNLDSVKGSYGEFDGLLLDGIFTLKKDEIFAKNLNLYLNQGFMCVDGRFGNQRENLTVTFDKFPLSFITEIDKKVSLSGNADGWINLRGKKGYISCENSFVVKDFNLNNSFISFLSFNSKFVFADNSLKNLVGNFYALNGKIFKKNLDILYAEIKKENDKVYLDLDAVSELITISLGLNGEFKEKDYEFSGNIDKLELKTDVDFLRLTKPIDIKISRNDLTIKGVSLEGKEGYVHLDLMNSQNMFDFDFEVMDKNLLLTRYFTGFEISGDALIYGKGLISDYKKSVNFSGKVKDINYYELKIDSIDFNCELENKLLKLNYFNLYNDENVSYMFGEISIKDFSKIFDSELNLNVKLNNIDGKYFVPLKNVFTVETKKGLELEGKISGTLSDPQIYGNVFVDSSNIYIVKLGTEIRNVTGQGVCYGNYLKDIELNGFTEKGKVKLTGRVKKKNWTLDNYSFDILADGVHSNGLDYVDAFAKCSLKILGDQTQVTTTGRIFINEGVSNFPFFIKSQESGLSPQSGYKTNLDLLFISEGNLWLKNNFVDVELKGEVKLKKENLKYSITGNAEVIRGTYFYLEKRFLIERGIFTFQQSSKDIDPFLDILASTDVLFSEGDERKEARISINVKGSASNPQIIVSSDPLMSIENILSVLSFNTTLNNITNFNDFTRTLPEKALQIYLRNRYLNLISSSIGVDQLDLNTTLLEKDKSAKLSVGKYIGKKLYLSYTHDIFSFSKDQFKIEYRFGKNSSFITERDEQGNFNSGIKFILRF
ncbi:MAG: translocation/assembly module TamB domain-containing protein [candidate division WOR-3 bacterium]